MKVSVEFSALNYVKSASVILVASCFGLSSQVRAQAQQGDVTKKEAKTNQHVDYSVAVNELLKLGFPSAKGAKYMKLNSRNLSYVSGLFNDNMGTPKGLTGNVFYLPAKGEKGEQVILQGGVAYSYSKSRSGGGMSGSLKDADLKKDLKTVATWIKKSSTGDDDNWDYYSTQRCVVAFGFANLAYHAGYKKEATELFKAIFLSHENPTQVIDSVINSLATTEYNEVYNAFNTKGNWQEYLDGLIRLQKKFPRGWINHPGLEILIPQVRKRAENKAVVYPSIAGVTFKPEVMKLIKSAYDPKSGGRHSYADSLFLINKPKKQASASPLVALTSYGMDGFIAITAMIGDETLVASRGRGYDDFGVRHYSSSEDGLSPESAYQSLSKPNTVGSMAASVIKNALPHPRGTLREMGQAELKRFAIEWWKKHKNDSTIELTKQYLKLGNENHSRHLSASLLRQNTKESLALLVDSILSSETPSEYQEIVTKYVSKRREAAKDFITKYEAVLRKEIGDGKEDDYSTSGQYHIKEMGGTAKYIAKLKRYTEPLDPALLLNMLSRKKANTQEILEQLVVAYQGKDISKKLSKFIYAMAKGDESKRRAIISALISITYGKEEDRDSKPLEKPTKPSFSKYEKEDIQKLLGSDTYVWFDRAYISTTVAIQFGMVLDKVYNPTRKLSEYDFIPYLEEEEITKIITDRSHAITEGKELKPLPSIERVKPERLKEVIDLIEKSPPSSMRKTFQALPVDERFAVAKHNEKNGGEVFSEGNKFIQGVENDKKEAKAAAIKALLQPLVSTEYNAKGIEKVSQFLLKNHQQTAGVVALFFNQRHKPGMNMYLELDDFREDPKLDVLNKKILAGELEAYTAVILYDDENTISDLVVFGDNSKVDLELITEMINDGESNFKIVTNNKANLENQIAIRKKTLPERTKLIKEIVKMKPEYEDAVARFKQLRLAELKDWHKRIKKNYDAEQEALKEAESEDSDTDGFSLPLIK